MPGTLFVVATPIGNLEDISQRALRTLREVDLIAAEDTRRSAKLLSRYSIRRTMVSLHAHNEWREAPKLVERLVAGSSIALVSDAGTPGISDPGEHLVRLAHQRGIKVVPIPGPSAIAAALSVSGLPASQFVFMGFPPRSGRDRREWMAALAAEPRTVVFFEAPHRIQATLTELTKLVNRQIQIAREMTKVNEQLVISQTNGGAPAVPQLGEFVLVVGPEQPTDSRGQSDASNFAMALRMIGCLIVKCTFSDTEALELTSRATGIDSRALKKALKKHRIQDKRRQSPVP